MNKIFMIKMMSQNLATPNRTAFTMPVLLQLFGRLAVKTSEGSRQDSNITWSGNSVISAALKTWQGPTLKHLCM